jgi:hypothetical protein
MHLEFSLYGHGLCWARKTSQFFSLIHSIMSRCLTLPARSFQNWRVIQASLRLWRQGWGQLEYCSPHLRPFRNILAAMSLARFLLCFAALTVGLALADQDVAKDGTCSSESGYCWTHFKLVFVAVNKIFTLMVAIYLGRIPPGCVTPALHLLFQWPSFIF